MGDGEEFNEFTKVFDMVKLSLSISSSSSTISPTASSSENSIHGFIGTPAQPGPNEEATMDEEEEELDLSLGLSLGGRFGVDTRKLVRSVGAVLSQATLPPHGADHGPVWVPLSGLYRASSVEVQAEWKKMKNREVQAEWKKSKVLDMLKRSEAKRRKLEIENIIRESGVGCEWCVREGGGGKGFRLETDKSLTPKQGQKRSTVGSQLGSPKKGKVTQQEGSMVIKGDQPSSVQLKSEVIQVSSGEPTQVSNTSGIQSLPETNNQEDSSASGRSSWPHVPRI